MRYTRKSVVWSVVCQTLWLLDEWWTSVLLGWEKMCREDQSKMLSLLSWGGGGGEVDGHRLWLVGWFRLRLWRPGSKFTKVELLAKPHCGFVCFICFLFGPSLEQETRFTTDIYLHMCDHVLGLSSQKKNRKQPARNRSWNVQKTHLLTHTDTHTHTPEGSPLNILRKHRFPHILSVTVCSLRSTRPHTHPLCFLTPPPLIPISLTCRPALGCSQPSVGV